MSAKKLTVQIQPDLISATSAEAIVTILESLGKDLQLSGAHITRGNDSGKYINVELRSNDIPRLWKEIKQALFVDERAGSDVKRGTVVVCSGDAQWKDYLLLHHYDASQRLDSLAKNAKLLKSRRSK